MSFSGLSGNFACPTCGTWQGPSHGDYIPQYMLCDECLERKECPECEEDMDEKAVRVTDEVFVPPYDAVFESEREAPEDYDD